MLASQAAIALENAGLYASLEQRVQERTRALAAANLNLQKEISQRLKAEEHIRHLAYHDTLTGLPNRKLFQERLGQELARAERLNSLVAVLFLDLDHFKDINDSYGHETGDMVLCEVAERLKSAVREFDLVSRLGGDEFTLFITGIQKDADIETVLVRIRAAFQAPLQVGGLLLPISCSVGMSRFPLDGTHPEELIWKADQAMYEAKRQKVG
jgi:diguanylate cyclase (GGDEF)-like protein